MTSTLNDIFKLSDISRDAMTTNLHQRAFDIFNNALIPTQKQEDWKYLPLNQVFSDTFSVLPKLSPNSISVAKKFISDLPYSVDNCLLNGSNLELTLKASERSVAHSSFTPDVPLNSSNPFEGLSLVHASEPVVLEFSESISGDTPYTIVLLYDTDSKNLVNQSFHIRVKQGCEVYLHLSHYLLGDRESFSNMCITVELEEHATCHFSQFKPENTANYFDSIIVNATESSSFNYIGVNLGASLNREEIRVYGAGSLLTNNFSGLSILNQSKQHFVKTEVHLQKPQQNSRQLFKNILCGKSQAEYNGLVKVYRDAQEIDSDQLNRNLVLSDDAKAYSRPQLRIDADDVSCTHGSTTGEVEKEELLYLQSRGISEEESRALLIYGFAEEIIEKLPATAIRDAIESDVRSLLPRLQ